MNQREQMIEWLSDAHAMEKGLIETLKRHAHDAKNFPDVQASIEEHIEITKRQANDLEQCLHQLGADPSMIKSSIAKIGGLFTGISNAVAKDSVIKNLLGDYALENFEIACYRSLISAATALQEPTIVEVCERNLEEEQAMADCILDSISDVTVSYLDTLELPEKSAL